jgi:hypothetical protein
MELIKILKEKEMFTHPSPAVTSSFFVMYGNRWLAHCTVAYCQKRGLRVDLEFASESGDKAGL